MPIPEALFAGATRPSKKGWVTRQADVIFKAGTYPFPAEQGGPFTMTPAEIKSFCAGFSKPIELEDTHHPSVFNKKLGHLVAVQSHADDAGFSGHIRIPKWLDDLFPNQPIPISPRWNRKTKQLTKLAIVPNPRITDAAMTPERVGAAFAAFADEGYDAEGDMAGDDDPDDGGTGMRPSDAYHKATQKIHDVIESCLEDPELTESERSHLEELLESCCGNNGADMGATETMTPVTPPGGTAAYSSLEAQIKELQEARFADTKERWLEDAKRFSLGLFRADKITAAQAKPIAEAYFQACLDDHQHPATVCFSAGDGTQKNGSRLDALKAAYLAAPKLGLQSELAADGTGRTDGDALFNQITTPGADSQPGPMTAERRATLLGKSGLGRVVLADERKRAATNGTH